MSVTLRIRRRWSRTWRPRRLGERVAHATARLDTCLAAQSTW